MAENIIGTVIGYRRGPRTQSPKECLIQFPDVESAGEAAELVGGR